ncbi:hypothetical protein J3F83DRAFT_738770 [Trichoderma novae-zelandiae]
MANKSTISGERNPSPFHQEGGTGDGICRTIAKTLGDNAHEAHTRPVRADKRGAQPMTPWVLDRRKTRERGNGWRERNAGKYWVVMHHKSIPSMCGSDPFPNQPRTDKRQERGRGAMNRKQLNERTSRERKGVARGRVLSRPRPRPKEARDGDHPTHTMMLNKGGGLGQPLRLRVSGIREAPADKRAVVDETWASVRNIRAVERPSSYRVVCMYEAESRVGGGPGGLAAHIGTRLVCPSSASEASLPCASTAGVQWERAWVSWRAKSGAHEKLLFPNLHPLCAVEARTAVGAITYHQLVVYQVSPD